MHQPSINTTVYIPSVTDVFSLLCILCKQACEMQSDRSKYSMRQATDKAQKTQILVFTDLA